MVANGRGYISVRKYGGNYYQIILNYPARTKLE